MWMGNSEQGEDSVIKRQEGTYEAFHGYTIVRLGGVHYAIRYTNTRSPWILIRR